MRDHCKDFTRCLLDLAAGGGRKFSGLSCPKGGMPVRNYRKRFAQ
jgi:hypothetical protein